jgi:hypothetical protein
LLGLSDDIIRQWNLLKGGKNAKQNKEKALDSEVDTSEGEGSEYDKDDYESEIKNKKRQRKENKKSSNKKKKELSAIVLPLPGDKTVAAEAFEKLTEPQNKMVADRVNKTTKKVPCILCPSPLCVNFDCYVFVFVIGCS